MGRENELNMFKALVGKFQEDMKSNSILELVVWVDCKIAKRKQEDEEQKRISQIRRN